MAVGAPPPARSTVTNPGAPRRSAASPAPWRSQVRRDQLFFVVLAIVLLGISVLLHNSLSQKRTGWNLVRETPESEKTVRSVAVNFPRLTLGGFRGILSTYLWQQAEEDKNNRKWLDLETKYDMIGALQPYFVSVYVYHSWNQAYNLSAQWQDQDAKYKWVLDGLAYLYKGEEYNPGNSDLYWEQAQIYFMKLGGAFERIFYREHWRDDISRLHELNDKKDATDDATVALAHVRAFVDRPYFHTRELGPPDESARGGTGWGVEITDPYLFSKRTDGKKAEEPMSFRYGLSTFYFAYVENRRAMAGTPPSTIGTNITDSRPAMSLRLWCRDDLYYTYDVMRRLFLVIPEADLRKNPDLLNRKAAEVQDCYRNVQTVGPRAIDLFNEHLGRYPGNKNIHPKHMKETEAYIAISKAEIKLFNTLVQWHFNGRKMNDDLKRSFLDADRLYQDAAKVTLAWVDFMYPEELGGAANPDRADSQNYVTALQDRSRGIQKLLTLGANEKPDLSFLDETPVEK